MNYLNRALHYCALFLLVACGAFPQNSQAVDAYLYEPLYQTFHFEPINGKLTSITKGGGTIPPSRTYRVMLEVLQNGTLLNNGNLDIQVDASGAIISPVAGHIVWNTDTRWVANPGTITFRLANATAYGVGFGNTVPITLLGDKTINLSKQTLDGRTSPGPAKSANMQVVLGEYNDCPPREDLMFTMDGTLGGSGAYAIELKIDGETVFGISGTYDGFGGPPLELSETAGPFNTASGSFTWAWVCNGQTVAGGTVGCADEILNNTIHAMFEFLLTKETVPKDPQEVPDAEKEQPPPSNTNPNPDGAKPGTAPDVVKPPSPGLPVGDPGHDMYRAFVAGLGTMNEGTFPGAPFTSGLSDYESEMQKRGRLDEIEGKLTEIAGQQGSIKDGLMSLNTAGEAMEDLLPSNIGKLNQWDWATFTLPTGQIVTIKLDMSTFLPMINQLRQILLLFVYIWFVWACGKEIVEAL